MEVGFFVFLSGSMNENLFKRLGVLAVPLEGGPFMIARMTVEEVENARRWPMERLEGWPMPLMPYDELQSVR
jgi:hypothetical protein